MAITRQTYRVWYDDDSFVDVRGDQRDIAAFERAAGVGIKKAQDTMTVVALRHIAYRALLRTGKLPPVAKGVMSPEQWDALVIEVEPVADEEPVDPTNEADSTTGPSASPSTPD
jgi:hypothetical protein